MTNSAYKRIYDSLVGFLGTMFRKFGDYCYTTQHRTMRRFLGVSKCNPYLRCIATMDKITLPSSSGAARMSSFKLTNTIPVWQWPNPRRLTLLEPAGHVHYDTTRISWLVLMTVTAGINPLRTEFIWETKSYICVVYLSSTWEYFRLWDLFLPEGRIEHFHCTQLYYDCWWPSVVKSQGITRLGMHLVGQKYSDLSSRRVNTTRIIKLLHLWTINNLTSQSTEPNNVWTTPKQSINCYWHRRILMNSVVGNNTKSNIS